MNILDKVVERISPLILGDNETCINYAILNKDGYGSIQVHHKGVKYRYLAHRVAYQITTNEDIGREDIICHTCDNPACINPKHLFKGTHLTNVQDKVNKDRQAKGKDNGRYVHGYYSKYSPTIKPKRDFKELYSRSLTREEAIHLKQCIKERKISLKALSEKLGVKYQTLRDLSCGRIYSNI
jgi:hypothetical protein